MSVPLWSRAQAPDVIRCHTAILGAGMMGVAAAIALEQRGVDALIVDRGGLASGASGRNAGFLMRGAADNYAAAVRDWGPALARDVWRLTERNLAMLREQGIETLPSVRRVPSCLLALDEGEAQELRTSAELMQADGFEVSIIESGRDAAWRSGAVVLGLVNPNDGACNPRDVLGYLAAKLRRPPLFHQEAARIEIDGPELVRLHLPGTVVESRRLLVCTNSYAPLLLPGLGAFIQPKRGQLLAFRTAGPIFDHSYYANHGGEYFRQPTPDTAIVGGWRRFFADTEVGYEDQTTQGVQQGLEQFIAKFVDQPLDVVARWSGVMGFTPDALPLIGPIDEQGAPASRSPVWLAAGCTGHGMSMFFATADHAVASMIEGASNPFPLSRPSAVAAAGTASNSH